MGAMPPHPPLGRRIRVGPPVRPALPAPAAPGSGITNFLRANHYLAPKIAAGVTASLLTMTALQSVGNAETSWLENLVDNLLLDSTKPTIGSTVLAGVAFIRRATRRGSLAPAPTPENPHPTNYWFWGLTLAPLLGTFIEMCNYSPAEMPAQDKLYRGLLGGALVATSYWLGYLFRPR